MWPTSSFFKLTAGFALVKAAAQWHLVRLQQNALKEAKAAAASGALAADQEAKRAKDAEARDGLTRRVLGNQAAALKSVATALQVHAQLCQALSETSKLDRLFKAGQTPLGKQHRPRGICSNFSMRCIA